MNKNINELVSNANNFYYNIILKKYIKYLVELNKNITINNNYIYFNNLNENFEYQILSVYNPKKKLWIWAWSLYNIDSNLISISKELLNYGLKLELINNDSINEHFYLKSLFVNSRFLIETYIELKTILRVISYILKKTNQFILKYEIKINDTDKLELFLIIYNI